MPKSLRFVLVGTGPQLIASADLLRLRRHEVVGVISDCPGVTAWAAKHGVRRASAPDRGAWPVGESFDYLLSIVNHALLPPELLAAPTRGAINYHDSPLPAFAGFNATAWAILAGRPVHGVTWHAMTAEADQGPILIQIPVEISPDDTGFSLAVKCSEAGIASFATLLDQLERGAAQPRPQEGPRSFHLRSDRPGLAMLDFGRPAAELHAMVRALNFGPDDNWMAAPKLALPNGVVAVLEARLEPGRRGPAGTVLSVSPVIVIAAEGGALVVTDLATLDGAPIECGAAAAQFGLVEGRVLEPTAASLRAAADEFDRLVTKSERFWVGRMANLEPAVLPEVVPHREAKRELVLHRSWPAALAPLPADRRVSALVAALAAAVHRLGGGDRFDFAAPVALASPLRPFYASVAPLRCTLAPTTTFGTLADHMAAEINRHQARRTYARDIALRYRTFRDRNRTIEPLSVGVQYQAGSEGSPSLVEGTHLSLVAASGAGYAWAYDEAAISAAAVEKLARRVEMLLAAGVAAETTLVDTLPLLLPEEQALVLGSWQETGRPFESGWCVHQFFERQVVRTPDAIAVRFGEAAVSYRTLNHRANQLAHRLREAGVGPETLVGICVERSVDMVVGLLGILKAGGAYVPMDPAYPQDRLAMMLEDSRARFLVVHGHLMNRLPPTDATVVLVDQLPPVGPAGFENPDSGVRPEHLAYVIFTSGSTGRPKGTMLEHRSVANFFAGMDSALADGRPTPGVWLAVTSISFDISVLELFWTLARGFEVVIAAETDRASLERRGPGRRPSYTSVGFGLFYFAADSGSATPGAAYRLLLEGAKFADAHDFTAVWTPERHFHAFGGLYPNPAITTAAIATITKRIHLRAGSVVLPLHNPLRVAEDWAMIDQLSAGRIGLSFASGWHVNDFAFMPENYERRREVMLEHIETITKLWKGQKVAVRNGAGQMIEVSVLPRPLQANPPMWIASAGSPETFAIAGRIGANVLTNMLGQDLADLKIKFEAYRTARRDAGFEGDGIISVMLHTFVCGDSDEARRLARKPFSDYLASSFDLVKVAPKMFPAFKQPSKNAGHAEALDTSAFTPEDMAALLDHAFDRYFDTAGLFGTPERALEMVDRLMEIGANEMACLIDFGIDPDVVLASLPHLHRLQELCRARVAPAGVVSPVDEPAADSIATLIRRYRVTHFQCTPSMARMLASDPESLRALATLDRLLLGGEALPPDLADQLSAQVPGTMLNMYGPTETTVWSTTSEVTPGAMPTIGRPIANTSIRILDQHQQLVPIGTPGELYIGGAGVARGYLGRPELTAERFVGDPWAPGQRLYRTGDMVRYRPTGEIEFLGRLDHQVKINGYRIELGEIETALNRHPLVRQGVVVARAATDAGSPALVAYLVPAAHRNSAGPDAERVKTWQGIWDEAYRHGTGSVGGGDPRFRISGWNDSYSGDPIPAPQMREWLDHTVDRIVALRPKRVLEIGCGTGLILYRVLEHAEHYTGVDLSPTALESIRAELTPAEASKVTLLQGAAHELSELADRSFDLVVINSVAQYFPDADYLARVLQRAVGLVTDGGRVFVGDIRSLAHLGEFHRSVASHQAAPNTPPGELDRIIERRIGQESELVVSEAFFHALARDTPRLSGVETQLKRGWAHNELSRFRYDVVLRVGSPSPAKPAAPAPVSAASLADIQARLATGEPVIHFADLPNARLQGAGIDPEALYTLHPGYHADLRWAASGTATAFDAIFRSAAGADTGQLWDPPPHEGRPADYANAPGSGRDDATIIREVRADLQSRLPEYMVPSAFVVLGELPLTPNGKIDRKALPDPARTVALSSAPYAPPTNVLEQQIGGIWQELLGVERVGRLDNIFDLGANSLLTMQANSRLSALLQRKVSLVSMFRFPTIAALAAHLDEGAALAEAALNDQRAQERLSRSEQAAQRRRVLRAGRTEG